MIYFTFVENCDLAVEAEQSLRLTRSASRRTQATPSSSTKASKVRASPRKAQKSLFKSDPPSPVKVKEASSQHLAKPISSPKKMPLCGNNENEEICPTVKPVKQPLLNSPTKLKLHHPNGMF